MHKLATTLLALLSVLASTKTTDGSTEGTGEACVRIRIPGTVPRRALLNGIPLLSRLCVESGESGFQR
jgi:hypothetical protein